MNLLEKRAVNHAYEALQETMQYLTNISEFASKDVPGTSLISIDIDNVIAKQINEINECLHALKSQ